MQAKKYQVFVSSTYTDLVEERRQVIEAIIDLGHIPAGMEGFPAIDMEQFRYIKKVIDQCDYYVLIVGARYGSLSEDGTSFTGREYRYAVQTGKIVIAFVLDAAAAANLPAANIETDPEIRARLDNFAADVMNGRLVRIWTDRNSLSLAVIKSLIAAFEEFPSIGWVRGSVQASEDVLAQINELRLRNEGLENENQTLRLQLIPVVENIAPLDVAHEFRYKHWTARSGDQSATARLTWRQIFAAVAPRLSTPQSTLTFTSILQSALSSAGLIFSSPSLPTAAADQVRIQLVALGLLREHRGKTTTGGIGEWVQLTDMGRKKMVEHLVIRG